MTLRSSIALALLTVSCTITAHAQTYPAKTVRVIVPFPPGGISDVLARVMAQHLTGALGAQLLVENRPGAGTTIAADVVAKAPPDGSTIYFIDMTTHAINATLYSKLPYDSIRDFTQINMVAQTPLIVVVHPSLPVKTAKDLIALAKSRPGDIVYASSGNGTIVHLSTETFTSMAGIKMVHVPYKGSAPAVAALLGGEVAVTFSSTPPALPHVQAGRLRALGVTSPQRSPLLPNVPALGETLKGYDIVLYSGVMGPPGMSREIVDRLNKELARMLTLANIKEMWAKQGADPVSMSPEQMTDHLKSDIQKLGKNGARGRRQSRLIGYVHCTGNGFTFAGDSAVMSTVDWAFERDADGLWRWTHADNRGMTRSRRRFSDLWDCVEDAKKHGLEERGDEGPAPALLH